MGGYQAATTYGPGGTMITSGGGPPMNLFGLNIQDLIQRRLAEREAERAEQARMVALQEAAMKAELAAQREARKWANEDRSRALQQAGNDPYKGYRDADVARQHRMAQMQEQAMREELRGTPTYTKTMSGPGVVPGYARASAGDPGAVFSGYAPRGSMPSQASFSSLPGPSPAGLSPTSQPPATVAAHPDTTPDQAQAQAGMRQFPYMSGMLGQPQQQQRCPPGQKMSVHGGCVPYWMT